MKPNSMELNLCYERMTVQEGDSLRWHGNMNYRIFVDTIDGSFVKLSVHKYNELSKIVETTTRDFFYRIMKFSEHAIRISHYRNNTRIRDYHPY